MISRKSRSRRYLPFVVSLLKLSRNRQVYPFLNSNLRFDMF